jgi:PAS domain S-box-containing protein
MLLNGRRIERAWGKERVILLAIEDITERRRMAELLADSEERYRRLFETASDGIVLLEKNEGHIAHANPAVAEMLGYAEAECLGKKLPEIGVSLGTQDFSTTMQALDRNGILNYEDVPVKTRSGQDIYTDIYMVDRAKLAQCNIRDVTERKKAGDMLTEAKNKAQNYLDVAGVMIIELDSRGRIELINKKGLAILGYQEHEVIGQNWFELCVPGAISEKVQEVFSKLMTGDIEQVEYFENPVTTKGGEERILAFHNALLRDASEETSGIICSGEDITERKKSEEYLQEERTFTENALNSLQDIFLVFDLEGEFLRWNKTLNSVSGYSDVEIAMMQPADFFRNDDKGRIAEAVRTTVREGSVRFDALAVTKDGRQIPYSFSASLLRDAQGRPAGISSVARDITEQKKLAAQLRQSQKMEAIGTLAGGIAHDFNNILNVIMGYGNMVMETLAADSPAREDMHEVLVAADRAADLTRMLLVFSQKRVVEMTVVNINELLLGLEKMLTRIIRESIEFRLDLVDHPLLVLADGGQIEQVLMNLAANAKDAMQGGGRLVISTGLEEVDEAYVAAYGYGISGRYALITVADTGEGMDAETQAKIFEPFFTTKGVGEGTGLGLAISYGIIKQHNGYLKVYSEPGEGTVFKIYLPLGEETAPAEKTADSETVKGGNETILVVEDDAALRQLSRIVLESFGYTVITAGDGDDAIAKFMENRERINLVLLDMIMPKKNGKEVRAAIRKVYPQIKILFVSGYTMDIITNKDLVEDGVDFIQKPYQSKSLLLKLREVLDR